MESSRFSSEWKLKLKALVSHCLKRKALKKNLPWGILFLKYQANHVKSQPSSSCCVINIISNSGSTVVEKGQRVLRPTKGKWRNSGESQATVMVTHAGLKLDRSRVEGSLLLPLWISGKGSWCVLSATAEQLRCFHWAAVINKTGRCSQDEGKRTKLPHRKLNMKEECNKNMYFPPFMHVLLDGKEAANISDPNSLSLLRCTDGILTLDLISTLVICTSLDFPFFTVKNSALAVLKNDILLCEWIHSEYFVTRYWKQASRLAKTSTLHVSKLKGFIWYFWCPPQLQSHPDTSHVCWVLAAGLTEGGRSIRVHEPTKAAHSWEKTDGTSKDGSTSLDGVDVHQGHYSRYRTEKSSNLLLTED